MASTYNLISYDSDDEYIQYPEAPPQANLMSACLFMAGLLKSSDINFAVMGGFALTLSGSQRITRNINIAVQVTMGNLWDVVMPEARLIIPDTKLISSIMRVFVKTGEGYDSCAEERNIEVDLILSGSGGSPRALGGHQRLVRGYFCTGEMWEIPCLNILYTMTSKLRVCYDRGAQKDLEDIKFILRIFPAEVASIRSRIDSELIAGFLRLLDSADRAEYSGALGYS